MLSFDESKAVMDRMASMKHLYYATKNINFWKFEMLPPPPDAPKSMVGIYRGIDKKKPEIFQDWHIDQADIDQHGSLEERLKFIHKHFAESLVFLGQAIDRAKDSGSRIILPKHMRHRGTRKVGFQLLEKGDLDH
jgi:hypothetical protein